MAVAAFESRPGCSGTEVLHLEEKHRKVLNKEMEEVQKSDNQQEDKNQGENMFLMMVITDEQPTTTTALDRLGVIVDDVLRMLHLK